MRRYGVTLVLILSVSGGAWLRADDDVPALVRRLEDPVQRESAARSILDAGGAALPHLEAVLFQASGASELLRREVLALLPRFGDPGIGPLARALQDRQLEIDAIRLLATMDSRDRVFPLMVGALSSPNPAVRTDAIRWIRDAGSSSAELRTRLFLLLEDPAEEVRQVAGEIIARDLGQDAVPSLMDLFRREAQKPTQGNQLLRQALLLAMGAVGAQSPVAADQVTPTLVQALYRDDQQGAASQALVRVGERAVPALLMVLKQGDEERAPAAMDALIRIGPQAAPEVVTLLTARHRKMRDLAFQFLSFYRDPSILPFLAATYKSQEPGIRMSAVSIAGLYDQDEAVAILEAGLKDSDPGVRLKAMEMIARSGLPQTVPLLLGCAEDDPELNIRVAAIQALFHLGQTSAVPSMVRMLQYEKWPIRMAILRALLWMGRLEDVGPIADQIAHRRPEVAKLAERVLANVTYLEGGRTPEDWVREVKAGEKLRLGRNEAFLAQSRKEIRAGVVSLEVSLSGSPGRGTILVVRSGEGIDDPWLLETLRPLADDHQLVLMDFPGCGAVSRGAAPDIGECLAWHAERMELVRSSLTTAPVIVIAHSVAGLAAAWYASSRPEAVSRLILLAPVYPEPLLLRRTARAFEAAIPARWRLELESLESLRGQLDPRTYQQFRSRAELAGLVLGQGIAGLVSSYYGPGWLLSETWIPDGSGVAEGAFARVRVPVLLVVGGNDPVPSQSLEAFRRIGRVRGNYMLSVIPGAMHFPHLCAAETTLSAITKFLAEVKAAPGPVGGLSSAVVTIGERGLRADIVEPLPSESLGNVGPRPVGLGDLMNPDVAPRDMEGTGPEPVQISDAPPLPETVLPPVVETPASGEDPGVQVTKPSRPGAGQRFWPWFTLASGVAVAVAGGVVNHLALEDGRRADRLDPFVDGYGTRFDRLVEDARTKMIIAYSGYGLGAAGVGVGLWLVLTQPWKEPSPGSRAWSLEPAWGGRDGPAGISGTLRF